MKVYMKEPRVTRRRDMKGAGSLYRRAVDQRWFAAWEVPTSRGDGRRRRTCSSATFCGVLKKRSELAPPRPAPPTRRRRTVAEEAARLLGTHTAQEWRDLVALTDGRCAYCDHVVPGKVQKDHRTPVSRGGSDAIDNIAPCCVRCNSMKHDLTEAEFRTFLAEAHPHGLPAPRPRKPRKVAA